MLEIYDSFTSINLFPPNFIIYPFIVIVEHLISSCFFFYYNPVDVILLSYLILCLLEWSISTCSVDYSVSLEGSVSSLYVGSIISFISIYILSIYLHIYTYVYIHFFSFLFSGRLHSFHYPVFIIVDIFMLLLLVITFNIWSGTYHFLLFSLTSFFRFSFSFHYHYLHIFTSIIN